ncbi:MAG: Tim44 domain-containing protein [Betaproteobacteria bacterium]|nr:MAG: Tim44 domain-containing protein [Betaproteobacteria bacterium]
MKIFSLVAAAFALGLTLSAPDAEAAKRLGGGSSSGMQRSMTAPAASPAQAPTAAAATRAPAAAAAPQAQPKRSWMGPIAGLAAGLGLAALASHLGFGEELASMMMIGLLVMAVLVVVGLIMRRRAAAAQPAMAGAGAAAGAMQYASQTRSTHDVTMPRTADSAFSGTGVDPQPTHSAANALPADFDAAAFVRQAKVNFIRLQASNDAGNLDDLREFTTPEMFAELKTSILTRGAAPQQTDIVQIDAEVLEVVEEASRYVVSVRYSGLVREDRDGPTEQIDEIWHLVKPRTGNGGWLLAGIQQA